MKYIHVDCVQMVIIQTTSYWITQGPHSQILMMGEGRSDRGSYFITNNNNNDKGDDEEDFVVDMMVMMMMIIIIIITTEIH